MRNVVLKIKAIQKNNTGQDEVVEFSTEGKYYKKNNADYIIYEESKFLDDSDVKTFIKITEEEIVMKRLGENHSHLEFRVGERHRSKYITLMGSLEVEVLTKKITNHLNDGEKGGMLSVEYEISMKGLLDGTNKIEIEIIA